MRRARTTRTAAYVLAAGTAVCAAAGCGTAARAEGPSHQTAPATSASAPSKAERRCANAHVGLPRLTIGPGAPPPVLTSILGVLREPATTATTLPSKFKPMGFSRIWRGSTRLLTTTGSTRWWLVAGTYTQKVAPACLKIESPAQRRHTLALERQRRLGAVTVLASDQPTPVSPYVLTASQIRAGAGVTVEPFLKQVEPAKELTRSTTAYGLVPDGVDTVTLTAPNRRVFTGRVAHNFVEIPVRYDWTRHTTKTTRVLSETFTMRWRNAAGSTIKTTRISAGSEVALTG